MKTLCKTFLSFPSLWCGVLNIILNRNEESSCLKNDYCNNQFKILSIEIFKKIIWRKKFNQVINMIYYLYAKSHLNFNTLKMYCKN